MFRIDDPSAVGALPAPAAAGTEGYFTEGNPGAGVPPTRVRADWLNQIQEELRAVVVAGGLTPSKTTLNQLLSALNALFAPTTSLGGASGWEHLPDGRLLQWGSLVTSASAGVAVSFPLAFPGNVRALVTGCGSAGSAILTFDTLTTTGFNMNGWIPSTGARTAVTNAWWIAIGA